MATFLVFTGPDVPIVLLGMPSFGHFLTDNIAQPFIAVYGLLIPPIGWSLALFVWAYAMASFVLMDLAKVLLFKRFERVVKILEKEAVVIGKEVGKF